MIRVIPKYTKKFITVDVMPLLDIFFCNFESLVNTLESENGKKYVSIRKKLSKLNKLIVSYFFEKEKALLKKTFVTCLHFF